MGKRSVALKLAVDPPPDLAIEVDLTFRTARSAYVALEVPEIWQYADRQLRIFRLQDGDYVESLDSAIFPQCQVTPVINHCLENCISHYPNTCCIVKASPF